MPLTNPPIKPVKLKDKKTKDLIIEEKEPIKDSVVNTSENLNTAQQEKKEVDKQEGAIDSRKEFFRLMAEKIKDKDFNINKAMLVKEELNKRENAFSSQESDEQVYSEEQEIQESPELYDEDDYIAGEDLSISDNDSTSIGSKNKPVNFYKKIVFRFLFLTIILLLVVSYFSFVKLDITINSEKNDIDSNLNFYAYSNGDQINLDRAIKSSITKVELEEKSNFDSSGEKNLGGEIIGKVKIINNYSKNQPLVANTRLLSSDDKLFRIKNTVNVPAGGSVEVDIYTDSITEDMAIGPDKFIIPGLWSGVQDKIYAESSQKFEFKRDGKKYIMEKDTKDAKDYLNKKILEQAELKAKAAMGSKHYILHIEEDSAVIKNSNSVGDEVASFELTLKNVVNIISFESEDIIRLAKQKTSLETSQDVSEIDANSMQYNLVSYDQAKNLAEISLSFSARTLAGTKNFIDKKHLSNLNKNQIEAYLSNIKEIKSFNLVFKPKFIERSPLLLDKINIEYR